MPFKFPNTHHRTYYIHTQQIKFQVDKSLSINAHYIYIYILLKKKEIN